MSDELIRIDAKLPATVANQVDLILSRLSAKGAVQRLWDHDPSLWYPAPDTQSRILQQLGWLDLPPPFAELTAGLQPWLDNITERQITDLLFVAPGMLARAARLWRDSFRSSSPQLRLHLLDSADPLTMQQQLPMLNSERTLVMRTSVSGTATVESLRRTIAAYGNVVQLALPANVSERFATLSLPGLAVAFLSRLDVQRLQAKALDMRQQCQDENLHINPGFQLGVVLGVLAQQGRDLLLVAAPEELRALATWIEALVAGSLSKHRRGFVPVATPLPPRSYADAFVVQLHAPGLETSESIKDAALLADAGVPTIDLTVSDHDNLAAQVMLWQVAVVVAAMVIGLNPFDAPDADLLNHHIQQKLQRPPIVLPQASHRISEDVVSSIAPILQGARFVALAAYLPPSFDRQLQALRSTIAERLDVPALLVYPLRDADFSLQLLHAGRPGGVILVLSAKPDSAALATTGMQSLHAAMHAQLATELEAWIQMGQRYIWFDLGVDLAAEFRRLEMLFRFGGK
jgi:glucose-6-phosphate isomerase